MAIWSTSYDFLKQATVVHIMECWLHLETQWKKFCSGLTLHHTEIQTVNYLY